METYIKNKKFTYTYNLCNGMFKLVIKHASQRMWTEYFKEFTIKEHNITLNPIQLQYTFVNNNIIFHDTKPSDNNDLVIELIFDILGKKYTVNLNLSEVILSDIQKLEYKVMELTEALNKLTIIVNKNYEDIIYAVEHGDLCNIEE